MYNPTKGGIYKRGLTTETLFWLDTVRLKKKVTHKNNTLVEKMCFSEVHASNSEANLHILELNK